MTMKNTTNNSDLQLEKQVCFSLYSATNAMTRAYRPLLDKLDLTYSQYLAMLVLWENNGINVKALGDQLHLDSGTLTPLLKRLESKGLVVRQRCEHDERARVMFLTEAGEALKQQAESIPQTMMCKSQLPLEELAALKEICDKLYQQLSK
ncbi:MarR family transcriptional regulator [Photobacterium swingsii]|uniref:MarR family transcriptional regulator n=1 Tax=Photobacterium swingsii TaxID=680026 RepID=A0A0J8Y2F6_9GAMM|nr:MarR family transcriptional regulator [Photobacterium swingsii]KMV31769.1 MarR family transcriptional regulator [Photobacterium swingsii]PSW25383.1 MarR family transcriptional regulator [Photobacterium swingsii]